MPPFKELFPLLIDVLSFAMILMALAIATVRTVPRMIVFYQMQSLALAAVTSGTALEEGNWAVGAFTIIPLTLAFLVPALLAQATVREDIPVWERLFRLRRGDVRRETRTRAMSIWLNLPVPRHRGSTLAFNLAVIIAAYIIAFRLKNQMERPDVFLPPNPLGIALSLLVLGLSVMIVEPDIVSQAIGLLVMEHGLFLAAVRLISGQLIVAYFVVGLFLYVMITLVILVVLLPDLHRLASSIEVQAQRELRG